VVPAQITRAALDAELPSIMSLASRHGWSVDARLDDLTIELRRPHPVDGKEMLLIASLLGYPAVPPTWTFVDPVSRLRTRDAFPMPGQSPALSGSVFIDSNGEGVICAHWNRDAYVSDDHVGPHGDWGDATGWHNAGPGTTRAANIAEMLATVDVHLRQSPGRLS
jgi:hypothetical protein